VAIARTAFADVPGSGGGAVLTLFIVAVLVMNVALFPIR
jgi:hypothetical protein